MLRLMTPCRPCKKEQLEASLNLLKAYVGDRYPVGIEIVGPWNDFFDPKIIKETKRNLQDLPPSFFLSLHAPFEGKIGSKRNFFSSKQGFRNLFSVMRLADELGVDLVNLHSSMLLSCASLSKIGNKEEKGVEIYRKKAIDKVLAGLTDIRFLLGRACGQKICVENVPYTWGGDSILDPKRMIYEVCFVKPEDFLKIINPKANIFATIDVCHLSMVYDSSQLLAEIKKLGKGLGHIHLSDLGEIWQPFISFSKEGTVLGEGRIGEKVFKELLRYFLEYSKEQDLGLVLEINDEEFVKRENLRKSFKILMKWLKELDR